MSMSVPGVRRARQSGEEMGGGEGLQRGESLCDGKDLGARPAEAGGYAAAVTAVRVYIRMPGRSRAVTIGKKARLELSIAGCVRSGLGSEVVGATALPDRTDRGASAHRLGRSD